jgi:hypothetical protein
MQATRQIGTHRTRRGCRLRLYAWVILAIILGVSLPMLSAAQQPTATIQALRGAAFVNNTARGSGAVLRTGDVLKTQAGARLVLEVSDGSRLEVEENTTIHIAELSQAASGAHKSHLKLLWGRVRVRLSQEYQKQEASFEVETPNALVELKFSSSEGEMMYGIFSDDAYDETPVTATTVYAYAVDVMLKNLLTGKARRIRPGSQGLVFGRRIEIMPISQYLPEDIQGPSKEDDIFQTRHLVKGATGGAVPGSTSGAGGLSPSTRRSRPESSHQLRRATILIH